MQSMDNYFFVGVGGIGMSALARYFNAKSKTVVGYDKTDTALTSMLSSEGISIHFEDEVQNIPKSFTSANTQIVYTPAIPDDHAQLDYFIKQGYSIKKRSEILGDITKDYLTIAVAGTHGKTTTSTMIAHVLHSAGEHCTAFLGGISTNFNSNILISDNELEQIVVVEADEYDRSFLKLDPDIAIITSVEADHLDIYGKADSLVDSFKEFANKIPEDGSLVVHDDFEKHFDADISYGGANGDYKAINIRNDAGLVKFDAETPDGLVKNIPMNQPGSHNIENALATIAVAQNLDVPSNKIIKAFQDYKGVKRRFEYIVNTSDLVYIDDYAHHPTEIRACLSSVKDLYPTKKITAIFQPHLFSRTRDFAEGFSESLSIADEVILCPIYPAREKPIEGINSEMLKSKITTEVILKEKSELVTEISNRNIEVLVTIGAGDIDKEIESLKTELLKKYETTNS